MPIKKLKTKIIKNKIEEKEHKINIEKVKQNIKRKSLKFKEDTIINNVSTHIIKNINKLPADQLTDMFLDLMAQSRKELLKLNKKSAKEYSKKIVDRTLYELLNYYKKHAQNKNTFSKKEIKDIQHKCHKYYLFLYRKGVIRDKITLKNIIDKIIVTPMDQKAKLRGNIYKIRTQYKNKFMFNPIYLDEIFEILKDKENKEINNEGMFEKHNKKLINTPRNPGRKFHQDYVLLHEFIHFLLNESKSVNRKYIANREYQIEILTYLTATALKIETPKINENYNRRNDYETAEHDAQLFIEKNGLENSFKLYKRFLIGIK